MFPYDVLNNSPTKYSWTNGKPQANVLNTTTGVGAYGVHNGFQISVPADTTSRTLKLYVGVWKARGVSKATISGSKVAYNNSALEISVPQATGHIHLHMPRPLLDKN